MVHRPPAETFTGVGILVVANMAVNGRLQFGKR